MSKNARFLKRQGANFLSLINDLKRNHEAAAQDLGVPVEQIGQIIAGEIDIPPAVLDRAIAVWPVNRRDFMIVEDDAPNGVAIMRAEASKASSRVFSRGGSPYYEYRDTAMSKLAPLRPEWILELRDVDDDDPESALVQWNHGHFMHQFTMFINAVNFYYMVDGVKTVMKANTGDSMYISPFVRHSFATRRKDSERLYGGQKGLILALTYGNNLTGDVQHELSALGGDIPPAYVLDTSSREKYFAALLKDQMDGMTLTPDDLARASSIPPATVAGFMAGAALPTPEQYAALATALCVNSRDLQPPDAFDQKVITTRFSEAKPRRFGPYRVTDLAATRYLPFSKAVILDVDKAIDAPDLRVPLHQYCYNFGERPVRLISEIDGERRDDVLDPGDSVYIKPHIPHAFSAPDGAARLLSLRVGGKTAGDPQRELSHIGVENIRRVYEEQSLWYKEERKGAAVATT